MSVYLRRALLEPFAFGELLIADFGPTASGAASVAWIRVPPGARHPGARSSRSEKLYLGVVGDVTFRLAGTDVGLAPGDLLVIPVGEWFAYRNDTGAEAEMALVHVPPFRLEDEELAE